jgi:hypothetical protein
MNEHAIGRLAPSSSYWVLVLATAAKSSARRRRYRGHVCGIVVSDEMLNMAMRRNHRSIAAGQVDLRNGDSDF